MMELIYRILLIQLINVNMIVISNYHHKLT